MGEKIYDPSLDYTWLETFLNTGYIEVYNKDGIKEESKTLRLIRMQSVKETQDEKIKRKSKQKERKERSNL